MKPFAETFPPGHFIQLELEARGWKQVDLAQVMGVSNRVVHELITGKRRITPKTATELADAFGSDPKEWLTMQAMYDYATGDAETDDTRRRKSALWHRAPMRAMFKRGWLVEKESVDLLESQVKQFYRISEIGESSPTKCAARKTGEEGELTKEQEAWFCRAWNLAESLPLKARYSSKAFGAGLFDKLSSALEEAQEIRHIPKVLEEYGIRFLIVEHLPGSKIDGICFWLNDYSPVVALSMRYDRIDWFWFTLCHELAHVYFGDGKESPLIDTSLVGRDATPTASLSSEERRANEFAEAFLVDQDELNDYVNRVSPLFSNASLLSFAKRIHVHPGIVVGQLHYKQHLPYSHGKQMLVPVKDIILGTALTDGWGHTVAI